MFFVQHAVTYVLICKCSLQDIHLFVFFCTFFTSCSPHATQHEMLKHNITEQEKKNTLAAWIFICPISVEEPVSMVDIEVIFLQEAGCKILFLKQQKMLELSMLSFDTGTFHSSGVTYSWCPFLHHLKNWTYIM
jgi:hypothetical protein